MTHKRRIVRAETPPTWPEIYAEIDTVAAKTKEEIDTVCDTRFSSVNASIAAASVVQLAAIESLRASLLEYRDSVAVTAEIEEAAKKGFGVARAFWDFLKAVGAKVKALCLALKEVAPIVILVAGLWMIHAGKITWSDAVRFITRGLE